MQYFHLAGVVLSVAKSFCLCFAIFLFRLFFFFFFRQFKRYRLVEGACGVMHAQVIHIPMASILGVKLPRL